MADSSFYYEFVVNAPTLDNYRFRLFAIIHNVDLYPVKFLLDTGIAAELGFDLRDGTYASCEKEFIAVLARIFGSQKTRNVIHAILSQSLDLSQENGSHVS